jgi:outer membrane protein assembly factor BamB
VRVTIHQADPAAAPYANYCADLVVSGRSVLEGMSAVPHRTAERLQRPCGGVACFGCPGAMQQSSRGPLAGAGDWTHLYADAANTLCSGDSRLRGPLGLLWFRDTDLFMPSRHGRGPAPLVANGRMFVEGVDVLRAVNVYNGTTLWEFPLPGILKSFHQDHLTGVAATGSNLCLGEDRLFVHGGGTCLVLDAATGQKTAQWAVPSLPDGTKGVWGYLAYHDGTLFGTVANQKHLVKESWRSFLGKLDMSRLYSESVLLFALDAQTGRLKWSFTPEHSIRHNALAVGTARVYLIDRPPAAGDTPQWGPAGAKSKHPPGRLLCLDCRTGQVVWQSREGIFGTVLALSEKHGVLVMTYQPTKFKLDSELGKRLAAYRARDGQRLWCIDAKYLSRPVLNDRVIYAEPGKWDLLTGAPLPFQFSRSHGCGILAGSSQLLVFRSATLGYVDLSSAQGTENYGGIRPGCWVNAIPAGGLVLMGDAASWCTCSYLNQATIALEPQVRKP